MAAHGPSDEQEQAQALLDHVEAVLRRELPLREGPYALELRGIPEEERKEWGGQMGPVFRDGAGVSAYLHFDGLDRQGRPWSIWQSVRMCRMSERSLTRVIGIVEAFVRVTRRAMRDAQDTRFGPRPWLALIHLANAMHTLHEAPPRRTRTSMECEAVLSGSPDLRNILAPPAEDLAAATAALDRWLAAHSTLVKTPAIELSHVANPRSDPAVRLSPQGVEAKRSGLFATLRLVVYDEAGVRDVKEQQVRMVPAAAFSNLPRVIAFLDGWAAALQHALEEERPTGEEARGLPRWRREPDMSMPHDLFDDSVLGLRRPRTAKDFAAVFARRWRTNRPR